ncbi:hypothetical protein ACFV9C_42745 [Kribbella sp. NPDC059898]|uniref:hypothetical protein n=1 Tax=Kribbella sp. NPDC059898 TaxID=3346995 RepID=UPI00365C95DB
MTMRPIPYTVTDDSTLWLDFVNGTGVNDAGQVITPVIGGRRSKPSLVDLLNTAHKHGATRIMLSGAIPPGTPGKPHWLTVETPGWRGDGHWLQARTPTGRFVHIADNVKVEVRLVREWFAGDDVPAPSAREAWNITTSLLRRYGAGGGMLRSPAGTGQNLWAHTLPRDPTYDYEATMVSDEIADLIHSTSGQHRTESFVAGDGRCSCGDCVPLITSDKIDGLAAADGRFMYAGLAKGELGVGPARMLTAAEATELWTQADKGRYVKARYRIRFTVPDMWDSLGLFGVQIPDSTTRAWHWPNRPGATYETWVDGAELVHDTNTGWWRGIEILEGIQLTKGRPLDTFIDRLLRARAATNELDATDMLKSLVKSALRAILLQTIGGFHSRGRARTHIVEDLSVVPPEAIHSVVQYGDRFIYIEEQRLSDRQRLFHRPELPAQVWAKERARMLLAPTAPFIANGLQLKEWGALDVDPQTLVAINGDAIVTTQPHLATIPVGLGGGDDGKEGKLRLKGWLPGPHPSPRTRAARDAMVKKAEAAGPGAAFDQLATRRPS